MAIKLTWYDEDGADIYTPPWVRGCTGAACPRYDATEIDGGR